MKPVLETCCGSCYSQVKRRYTPPNKLPHHVANHCVVRLCCFLSRTRAIRNLQSGHTLCMAGNPSLIRTPHSKWRVFALFALPCFSTTARFGSHIWKLSMPEEMPKFTRRVTGCNHVWVVSLKGYWWGHHSFGRSEQVVLRIVSQHLWYKW